MTARLRSRVGRQSVALLAIAAIIWHWLWEQAVARHQGQHLNAPVASHLGLIGLVTFTALLAWALRTGCLLLEARRAVGRLGSTPWPDPLLAAVRRTGVHNVRCLPDPSQVAFCAGASRPRVFVTSGMAASLCADALDAILLHEAEHARRRDPLRRAAAYAAADLFFFVPLVDCVSECQLEGAELAADRAAIARLGPGPVALALSATTAHTRPPVKVTAPFDGAVAARVAQLAGEQVPMPGCSLSSWLASAGQVLLLLNLAACALQAAFYAIG
jgi:BlaR1 peptidase M56